MGRRRHRPEEHENHERWLVSYADFITLLFAFFVVMYSISSVNEGKFRVLADTLVAAFKTPNKSMNPIQIGKLARSPYRDDLSPLSKPLAVDLSHHGELGKGDAPEGSAGEDPEALDEAAADGAAGAAGGGPAADAQSPASGMADLETVAGQVERKMADLIERGLMRVRRGERWLEVELKTSILFASGEAHLAPEALPVLRDIAEILKDFPNPIQVEGFTDDVPINTPAFPSNWELSAARAASVVHLFTKVGIRPERMVAIGYGQYRPVADNSTPEGRAKNRRVVLVIPAAKDARRILDLQRLASEPAGSSPPSGPPSPAADPGAAPGPTASGATGELTDTP